MVPWNKCHQCWYWPRCAVRPRRLSRRCCPHSIAAFFVLNACVNVIVHCLPLYLLVSMRMHSEIDDLRNIVQSGLGYLLFLINVEKTCSFCLKAGILLMRVMQRHLSHEALVVLDQPDKMAAFSSARQLWFLITVIQLPLVGATRMFESTLSRSWSACCTSRTEQFFSSIPPSEIDKI